MIDWVVTTMRNVKIAIETANLNGYVYDVSLQLHYKKPGTSVMHRDLAIQVGGGGKTAKKPAPAATPPLCNICGGNLTMDVCRRKSFPDTIPDVSVRWSDSAVGKAWKYRHNCNYGWTNGHPRQLREVGRACEKESRRVRVNQVKHLPYHVHA
jgi:hypothetical protein